MASTGNRRVPGRPLSPPTTPTGTKPEHEGSTLDERPRRSRRRMWRWVRRGGLAFAIASAIGAMVLASYIRSVEASLPSTAELRRG